jgi:hypothetical protein
MHRPPLPPGNIPGTHFCWRLNRPQDHSATGRIMSMKKSIDTIGNRTRDLLVCSAVPQPLSYRVLRCKMGTGSFPGVESGRGVTMTPHPLLVSRSNSEYSYTSTLPIYLPTILLSFAAYRSCAFFMDRLRDIVFTVPNSDRYVCI